MTTSLPRATIAPASGRSMIVRVRSRTPAVEREAEEEVDEPDAARDVGRWSEKRVKTPNTTADETTTPRSTDHMSRVETYRHQWW